MSSRFFLDYIAIKDDQLENLLKLAVPVCYSDWFVRLKYWLWLLLLLMKSELHSGSFMHFYNSWILGADNYIQLSRKKLGTVLLDDFVKSK